MNLSEQVITPPEGVRRSETRRTETRGSWTVLTLMATPIKDDMSTATCRAWGVEMTR